MVCQEEPTMSMMICLELLLLPQVWCFSRYDGDGIPMILSPGPTRTIYDATAETSFNYGATRLARVPCCSCCSKTMLITIGPTGA